MSASRALRRASETQLQFAGPWARGRLPATTVPGYAPAAFSLLIHPPVLHCPMLRSPDAPRNLSRTLDLAMPVFAAWGGGADSTSNDGRAFPLKGYPLKPFDNISGVTSLC